MEVFWNYLARNTCFILLFALCIIQEDLVDAVRGGQRQTRTFRRNTYYLYTPTSQTRGSSGSVAGVIIGCIGAAIFIAVGMLIVFCICKKSRSRQDQGIQGSGISPPPYSSAPVYYVSTDDKDAQMGKTPLEYIPSPPPYNEICQTPASPPAYEPTKY